MKMNQPMAKKILIVDDDRQVQTLIKRALAPHDYRLSSAFNGHDAIRLAEEEKPDLIILDIFMPEKDGLEVAKDLRRNQQTQMIPIMMLTGSGQLVDKIVGFELGADDYVTKPFESEELRVRVQSMFRRNSRDLSANPLTRLPGSPVIEEFVSRLIQEGKPFSFFYIDIDNFKAFNDVYGYDKGDQVIQETAAILLGALKSVGTRRDLLGHIGGDDFVIVADPQFTESVAIAIVKEFDRRIPSFYSLEDQSKGTIVTEDRLGRKLNFPLMTLSIAIASNANRPITHYAQVSDIVGEIKRYLKSLKDRKGSVYLKDRRNGERLV